MRFESQFTQMPNVWLRDVTLSYQARGVLGVLMSHDVGWSITVKSLIEDAPNGRESVQSAIRELEDAGYLSRVQRRNAQGQMSHIDWELSDPHYAGKTRSEPLTGKPADGEPATGKATSETRPTIEDHLRTSIKSSRGNHTAHTETCNKGHERLADTRYCVYGCAMPELVSA